MPSPFPGMDPYLETPLLWPDVHHAIISQIQIALNPRLRPKYVARVELRVYVSDDDDPGREVLIPDLRITERMRPAERETPSSAGVAVAEPLIVPVLLDDEIKEARLEIRDIAAGSLVTVIEVLSPTNKIRGSAGRKSFMDKKQEVLRSDVHWVEIDLLRAGTPSAANLARRRSDYRILVSRHEDRRKGKFWPITVRQPLPVIGIPLRGDDPDVPLDLGAMLNASYEGAAYDLSIDYQKAPDPPLRKPDAAWARKLLRAS